MTTKMLDLLGFSIPANFVDQGFPKYNIVEISDKETRLDVALPGYKKEDITVSSRDSKLIISAPKIKNPDSQSTYVHKGFSTKAFSKTFIMHPGIEVSRVQFIDGVLSVGLIKTPDNRDKVFTIA